MRRSTCTRALSVCTVRHLTACALGPSIVSLNTKTPPPPPPHGMARHGPLALSALLGQRYEGPRANASQSQCEGPRANARHRLPTPRCAKIENTSSAIFRATVQPRSLSVALVAVASVLENGIYTGMLHKSRCSVRRRPPLRHIPRGRGQLACSPGFLATHRPTRVLRTGAAGARAQSPIWEISH